MRHYIKLQIVTINYVMLTEKTKFSLYDITKKIIKEKYNYRR